jgi:hypothetical protein
VEGPYYEYSGRSMYDIRRTDGDEVVSKAFVDYLNLPSVREALGVNLTNGYEMSSQDVYFAFQQTGDYVYPIFLEDLGFLLDRGVRVV